MRNSCLIIGIVAAGTQAAWAGEGRRDYPVQPVPFYMVHVADAFWAPRLETNRTVTIPHELKMCEETGRIDNFAIAGQLKEGKFRGIFFNDSDVYKLVEAAAYTLVTHPDPGLSALFDDVIYKIAAAQERDGYLYTCRTISDPDKMPPGGKERWSDIANGHELYNAGHLYEAAVAHSQATGNIRLLGVALRNADLVCRTFGVGLRGDPPGHPEIEIGLVKLFRATGNEKYLNMAKFFIEERGLPVGGRKLYGEYAQDDKPILQQDQAVGHAVRAAYLYSGLTDVGVLTGHDEYTQTSERLWEDVVAHKMYLTGGLGARGGGEAFGARYELPNRSAYAETCAAIANALWTYRLFLVTGDAKYIDVLERVIYNGFLSGVSLEGNRFFYTNPLESAGAERVPWFDCACCPPNIARFFPSIPGFAYARGDSDLYINLFIGGTATVELLDGPVELKQVTRYPWDGTVMITLKPNKSPARFTVNVRIPGWAQDKPVPGDLYRHLDSAAEPPTLKVNGEPVALAIEKGFARLSREWKKGDAIELVLPMPIRRVVANDKVTDDLGRVALERGPLVYCSEGVDQPAGRVLSVVLPDDAVVRVEPRPDVLGGIVALRGTAQVVARGTDGTPAVGETQELLAIPYYAWANRARGEMEVWLARQPSAAKPLPGPTIAFRSRASASFGGDLHALTDQLEPTGSSDQSNPIFHFWPHKGTQEWVQYDFEQPARVSGVEVYWFDDTGTGQCRLPKSWRLLASVGGQWQEVGQPSGYGVEQDQYNRTTFNPVEAAGLRLEIQLAGDFAAGILEWRVLDESAATVPPTGGAGKP